MAYSASTAGRPLAEGVRCLLFDEFHERRRDADLAFALLEEARPLLAPDLAVVVMSATLDLSDLRERLPQATVLESDGRAFPVDTIHQPPRPDESLPQQVLRAIEGHALNLPSRQGALVFLRTRRFGVAYPAQCQWSCRTGRSRYSMARCPSATSRGPAAHGPDQRAA